MFKKICLLCISVLVTLSLTSCLDLTKYTEVSLTEYEAAINEFLGMEHCNKEFEATFVEKSTQEFNFYKDNDYSGDSLGSVTIEDNAKMVTQADFDSEIIKAKCDSSYNLAGTVKGVDVKDMPFNHSIAQDYQVQKYKDTFHKIENGKASTFCPTFDIAVMMAGDSYLNWFTISGYDYNEGRDKFYVSDNAYKCVIKYEDGSKYTVVIKFNDKGITITKEGTYYKSGGRYNVDYVDGTNDRWLDAKVKVKIKSTIKIVYKNITLDPIDTSNIE